MSRRKFLSPNLEQKGTSFKERKSSMSKKIRTDLRKQNGEGTIYFSKDKNRWVGQVTLGLQENGKLHRVTRYGKTQREVREKLKQAELMYQTGTLLEKSKISIYDIIKVMLDEKLALNKIKESTYYRNIETLKTLESISHIPLQQLNALQITAFLSTRTAYSQSVINKQYVMLSNAFEIATKKKIISENIFLDVNKPKSAKQTKKVRALTSDEQTKLYNVLTNDNITYKNQMLLSMLTGMRMGEINALRVEDINFTFKKITVNKTITRGEKGEPILNERPKTDAGERIITFTNNVEKILKQCVCNRTEGILFLRKGKLVTTNQVNSKFNRILKEYSIIDDSVKGSVNLHSLRHTYATRCIEAGMPPKVLQKILGHADVKITLNTYCDVFNAFESEYIAKTDSYLSEKGIIKQA